MRNANSDLSSPLAATLTTTAAAVLTVSLLAFSTACHDKGGDGATASPAPPSSPATAEPPPIAPRIAGAVGDTLDAYDSLRLALAHDDATAVAKSAATLSQHAHTAVAEAAGGTKAPLTDLVAAADVLAKAEPSLAGQRAAFGDVSKAIVALVVADPSLRTGRFLFLCPMAKGYQKWVQTTQKLENPFFGKSMSDCGEQLKDWTV